MANAKKAALREEGGGGQGGGMMMRGLLAWVVVAVQAGVALGAAEVEQRDLFKEGDGGYALYRIPGVVVTPKGTVLAYCEARKRGGDWGRIDIMLRRSEDGGRTWSEPETIVEVKGDLPMNPVAAAQNLDQPGENTANNPVAIVDHETGAIHFLYCLEYMRLFYMRSEDEGRSWSEAVEITPAVTKFREVYDWRVIATGPGHGIQLQRGENKGRLVVPVWYSTGTGGHAHRPSVVSTIYSDDHGRTWECGEIAVPNTAEWVNPNETAAVELADGWVMLNSRNESKENRRLVTVGPNGASGWSEPRFEEELLEPICMAGMVRVKWPAEGERSGVIAFSNPHNLKRADGKEKPGGGRDRRNLTVKLSFDEGKSWPVNRVLEPEGSGYSDLAVLGDGRVVCFYERGEGRRSTGKLTVVVIDRGLMTK